MLRCTPLLLHASVRTCAHNARMHAACHAACRWAAQQLRHLFGPAPALVLAGAHKRSAEGHARPPPQPLPQQQPCSSSLFVIAHTCTGHFASLLDGLPTLLAIAGDLLCLSAASTAAAATAAAGAALPPAAHLLSAAALLGGEAAGQAWALLGRLLAQALGVSTSFPPAGGGAAVAHVALQDAGVQGRTLAAHVLAAAECVMGGNDLGRDGGGGGGSAHHDGPGAQPAPPGSGFTAVQQPHVPQEKVPQASQLQPFLEHMAPVLRAALSGSSSTGGGQGNADRKSVV